jgi:hypothetical protein
LPARVYTGSEVPPVYRFLETLPDRVVVAEFPFGSDAYELRYVYYSTVHWHRLLNGYSGGFPASYFRIRDTLLQAREAPDRAWRTLLDAGATHVVVHQDAFLQGEDRPIRDWLQRNGAKQTGTFGDDLLFELPTPQERPPTGLVEGGSTQMPGRE